MDQVILDVPQTHQPDATDACGCTPHRPATGGSPAATTELSGVPATTIETPPVAEASRRALKLVLTLEPVEAGQFRAALAIGAEGCDPLLRSTTVSGLDDALRQVPTLVEVAEARWRLHPRNPATARAPSQQPGPKRDRSDSRPPALTPTEPRQEVSSDEQVERERGTPPATEPAAAPTRPTGGQLTLFG